MKTITTLTAVAALMAGMSMASAQNSGQTTPNATPPSNINAGSQKGTGDAKSGMQSGAAATQKMKSQTVGEKTETSPPSSINAGTQTGTGNATSGGESKGTAMKSGAPSKQTTGAGSMDNPSPSSLNAGSQKGTGDSTSGKK